MGQSSALLLRGKGPQVHWVTNTLGNYHLELSIKIDNIFQLFNRHRGGQKYPNNDIDGHFQAFTVQDFYRCEDVNGTQGTLDP